MKKAILDEQEKERQAKSEGSSTKKKNSSKKDKQGNKMPKENLTKKQKNKQDKTSKKVAEKDKVRKDKPNKEEKKENGIDWPEYVWPADCLQKLAAKKKDSKEPKKRTDLMNKILAALDDVMVDVCGMARAMMIGADGDFWYDKGFRNHPAYKELKNMENFHKYGREEYVAELNYFVSIGGIDCVDSPFIQYMTAGKRGDTVAVCELVAKFKNDTRKLSTDKHEAKFVKLFVEMLTETEAKGKKSQNFSDWNVYNRSARHAIPWVLHLAEKKYTAIVPGDLLTAIKLTEKKAKTAKALKKPWY